MKSFLAKVGRLLQGAGTPSAQQNSENMDALLRQVRQWVSPQTIYLGDFTALTRLRSGHKIYVDTRDTGIASHLMMDGRWEHWVESALIPELKPGMVFCDVGANFGYYTLLGAQAVTDTGKVYAVECNPRLHKLLRRSVMVNGLSDIVEIKQAAASNSRKRVTLTVDLEFSGGGTTLPVGDKSAWTREKFEVDAAPLDELVSPARPVNIMKIDVEGAEPLVIAGAQRILGHPDLKLIVTEFYAPAIAATIPPLEFLQQLEQYGFSLQIITDSGVGPKKSPAELIESIGARMTYIRAARSS